MTEICVCGHPKDEHRADPYYQFDHCAGNNSRCRCGLFRECLPWPNEPGCYWISGVTRDDDGNKVPAKFLVPCLAQQVLNRIWIVWGDKTYLSEDWGDMHGPARFTKLIETSPFPEQP